MAWFLVFGMLSTSNRASSRLGGSGRLLSVNSTDPPRMVMYCPSAFRMAHFSPCLSKVKYSLNRLSRTTAALSYSVWMNLSALPCFRLNSWAGSAGSDWSEMWLIGSDLHTNDKPDIVCIALIHHDWLSSRHTDPLACFLIEQADAPGKRDWQLPVSKEGTKTTAMCSPTMKR